MTNTTNVVNRNYLFEMPTESMEIVENVNIINVEPSENQNNQQNNLQYEAVVTQSDLATREEINAIKEEIISLKENIKVSFIKVMAYLQKLDKDIAEISNKIVVQTNSAIHTSQKRNLLEDLKLPLTSCEDIVNFEDKIRLDKDFKAQLIEMLSAIGGTSGQEDGMKIGYKIIDHVFSSDLLLNYNWTGVTRGKSGEKKSFQNFQGIMDTFFEVILLADNRHTKQRNANLFKQGVLKHAKKRSQRKSCQKTNDENQNENVENLNENPDILQANYNDRITNEEDIEMPVENE